MNELRCVREEELLDALDRAFVPAELEAHVGRCAVCSDLRLVAGALLDDRIDAIRESAVPSAGTMWFRMQLRQQREAAAIARRWLFAGQAATLFIALALVGALFGAEMVAHAREFSGLVQTSVKAMRISTALLSAMIATALLVPIAGVVALRQK